jgi:hypothetical protein
MHPKTYSTFHFDTTYLKMFHLVTAKLSIAMPLSIPQIACRVDYIMVNCLIDAVHKYIIKNIGTSRKRLSKVNKIPSKRLKQPKYEQTSLRTTYILCKLARFLINVSFSCLLFTLFVFVCVLRYSVHIVLCCLLCSSSSGFLSSQCSQFLSIVHS